MSYWMTFGQALDALREGKAVARRDWEANGRTEYLVLVPGRVVEVSYEPMAGHLGAGTKMSVADHIDVVNEHTIAGEGHDSTCVVGWQPNQVDILADDWVLVEGD